MFQNKFLNDFMRNQSKLVHEAAAASSNGSQSLLKDHKGRKKSKNGTANGLPAFGELTLDTLISEKPPKKEVLEYFRNLVDRLVAEELATA